MAGRGATEGGPAQRTPGVPRKARRRAWIMLQYSNGSRRAISGASLAQLRRHLAAPARACLAADIVDGKIILQGLTAKSIAGLCGVNLGYVDQALKLTPEQRAEVCRG